MRHGENILAPVPAREIFGVGGAGGTAFAAKSWIGEGAGLAHRGRSDLASGLLTLDLSRTFLNSPRSRIIFPQINYELQQS